VSNITTSTDSPEAALASAVVAAIARAIGTAPAALHEPQFSGNEWEYLKDCLDSTFVSSVGPYVDRFEREIAAFTGAKCAVAVVNGTAALHMALLLAGVEAQDEVLTPALTFVATANAVSYCNAVPHFVDCEEATLGVSAKAVREHLRQTSEMRHGVCVNRFTGRRISALLPMHAFGHAFDVDGLLSVAHDFNLVLVEDAAESLGSYHHGQHTGTFGRLGVFSFNGNKTITTGGGGAIVTQDEALARKAKHLTTTAKLPHRWAYEHDEIGYNYRMPNLNAALGCAQLEQLPDMLKAKRALHECYHSAFAGVTGMRIVKEPPGCHSNYWLQALLLDTENLVLRDVILEATAGAGYMTRPIWMPLHKMRPYAACPRMSMTVTTSLEQRLINLPSSSCLSSRVGR
jgi:aminotransferase in exopolysaccharide biosynthesis